MFFGYGIGTGKVFMVGEKVSLTPDVGNRVWTENGYPNHGPMEGPKVDIAPRQGGTIIEAREKYIAVSGYTLYSVRWDNEQLSKHYRNELLLIGPFQNVAEFEKAIRANGTVQLTVGPSGGFRSVRLDVEHEGKIHSVETEDGRIWREHIEPPVTNLKLTVETTKLKMAKRTKSRP